MKKLVFLLLLLSTIIIMGGCARKSSLKNINGEELFNLEDKSYFVYIYEDDCEECEQTLPIIESYLYVIKEEKDYKNKSTVYGLNISKEQNSIIARKYEGDNGQGANGKSFINDVTNWEELYIGTTPTLISIRVREGQKYAGESAQQESPEGEPS